MDDALMSEDPERQEMAENIGEALMEWSRVEHVWANIFRDLLFGGIGEASQRDPATGQLIASDDSAEKSDRADAIFFAQKSSHSQFTLIEEVGKVSLADREPLLAEFLAVLRRTRTLAGKRNSIAHAYYDSRLEIVGSTVSITPMQMLDFGRFKTAPTIDIVDVTNDFTHLADDIYAFWEKLLFEVSQIDVGRGRRP